MRVIGQIVAGLAIMMAILITTPFLELMEMFFWVVCIPLLFLTGLGLVTEGAIYTVHELLTGFFLKDLRASLSKWREHFRSSDADAEVYDR